MIGKVAADFLVSATGSNFGPGRMAEWLEYGILAVNFPFSALEFIPNLFWGDRSSSRDG